jgi:hypothetical protein
MLADELVAWRERSNESDQDYERLDRYLKGHMNFKVSNMVV